MVVAHIIKDSLYPISVTLAPQIFQISVSSKLGYHIGGRVGIP